MLSLNTVQTNYVPFSQPKIWRKTPTIGGVSTLETQTFRMYGDAAVQFSCEVYSVLCTVHCTVLRKLECNFFNSTYSVIVICRITFNYDIVPLELKH